MKKTIAAVVFIFVLTTSVFGQTDSFMADVRLLDTKKYSEYFGFKNGNINIGNRYVVSVSDDDHNKYGNLGGEYLDTVDTPLEFALLSHYSQFVLNIRPVEANTILPANNPKLADQKLGAAVLQEIQILKFLGNTVAVGRHEGILKFITDRGNVMRAEIETFYRNSIRALISEAVDEEFNRISFSLENARTNSVRSHNAVLTRNPQNGYYTLKYSGAYTINGEQEITKPTLNELVAEMERRKTEFDQTGINNLKAQADLIPAVVYADPKVQGIYGGADALALVKDALTNFYINPTQDNYRVLLGIEARYVRAFRTGTFSQVAHWAFWDAVRALSEGLYDKLANDPAKNSDQARRYPLDARYEVFEYRGR